MDSLALIAGDGRLPHEIAAGARAKGLRVVAFAFEGITRRDLAEAVDDIHWLPLGQLERLLSLLGGEDASQAVMAGKVSKQHLFATGAAGARVDPDGLAIELVAELRDRQDDSILRALADLLEQRGLPLQPQARWVPHLVPEPGPLGSNRPSEAQLRDLAFGWRVAKAVSGLDIGQSVVVRDRAVIAVEAIEGTDACILRGGALGGPGTCVVKVAKPAQDPRFDLPAIGAGTLERLIEAQAAALAFEAGQSLLLDRDQWIERADAHGIVLIGFSSEGPEALGLEDAD